MELGPVRGHSSCLSSSQISQKLIQKGIFPPCAFVNPSVSIANPYSGVDIVTREYLRWHVTEGRGD